jgi:hypothetical protein
MEQLLFSDALNFAMIRQPACKDDSRRRERRRWIKTLTQSRKAARTGNGIGSLTKAHRLVTWVGSSKIPFAPLR